MRLRAIGPNQTEVTFTSGNRVLFSYETPVAAWVAGEGYVKSLTHYSTTTRRHINQWLDGSEAETVEQHRLDTLAI